MGELKLSILIPSLSKRQIMLDHLISDIWHNMNKIGWQNNVDYEIRIDLDHGEELIGTKRNYLLGQSKGQYLMFIDDDDMITEHTFPTIKEGIEKGVDCVSLRGLITIDDGKAEVFEHSIKYKEWKTNSDEETKLTGIRYLRNPNHLNCIKSSIAKQFQFPNKNFSEDHDWSKLINSSGLLKTEFYHEKIIYLYIYNSNK